MLHRTACTIRPCRGWLSLLLALSFGSYGLVKKQAPVAGVQGLALETLFLLPFSLLALGRAELAGHGQFLSGSAAGLALVATTGLATTLPLLARGGN